MNEEQKDTAPNNSDNIIIPPTSTTEYVDEPTTDIPNTNNGNDYASDKNKETINVTVNIPQEESKAQITSNKIQFAGIMVSIGLGVLTFILLLKTIEANKTSKDSLYVAQQSLKDSRIKDSASEIKEKKIDSLNNIIRARDFVRDTTNIGLSKNSLNAQIESFRQTQKDFELESRAFLQALDITLDTSALDKPFKVTYISNKPIPGNFLNRPIT